MLGGCAEKTASGAKYFSVLSRMLFTWTIDSHKEGTADRNELMGFFTKGLQIWGKYDSIEGKILKIRAKMSFYK